MSALLIFFYVIMHIEMFGSCVAVLAMAVAYEGLKAARQWLKEAAIKHKRSYQEDSGRETPLDDVPIILRNPAFLTGLVC